MAGFLKNLFGSKQKASTSDPDLIKVDTLPEELGYVEDVAMQLVRGGYQSRNDILDAVKDCIEDEGFSYPAEKIVDAEIQKLVAEQAEWGDNPGDYHRLRKAFAALEDKGIVARENFTCCNSCGVAEIDLEIEQYENGSQKEARGYTFFHQQDTDRAAEGYGVYLNYGRAKNEGSDEDSLNIGKEIAEMLESSGLTVKWNRELSQKIFIDLDWKRPWVG